jgi:D-alanyl-D-alanine carboxypeptidase
MVACSVLFERRRLATLVGLVGMSASLLVAFSSPADAARRGRQKRAPAYSPPYAAMVVDVKTGRTLHAQSEDALRHPASVTKVMTLFMLFEQLERGKLSLDTPLSVSANAARQAPSKLALRPGSTIEVEDAIKALVTKSANDVAVVIAENLAGSEEAFAEQMTRKARTLGMSRTTYRNASGLPNPEQITTARDLTVLARAIQDRFPKYYRYFQTRVFHYAGRAYGNHNKLLGRVEGVDGIKTGFTRASGFNLMTNAKTDDRHIVAVVLGGRSGASRDQIMAGLVRSSLPRAYAGARSTPQTAESMDRPRPAVVAEAPEPRRADPVTTASTVASATPSSTTRGATTDAAIPTRKPLDIQAMRPVVASAAGATSTATPSALGWRTGAPPAQALPATAHAYASIKSDAPTAPLPPVNPAAAANETGKIQARLPVTETVAAKAEMPPEPRREAVRNVTPTGWIIQLGAMDDEGKAKQVLDEARSRTGRTLSKALPFTEKIVRGGATLYRARFSGFEENSAQEACRSLKRSGFNCFVTRS